MRVSTFAAAGLALCLSLMLQPASAQADAKDFVRLTPEQADWKDVPNGHGVQMAVVSVRP